MRRSDSFSKPAIPESLPRSASWLSGEIEGFWFVIERNDEVYSIARYSQDGTLECSGYFRPRGSFSVEQEYRIVSPSHCGLVTVIQNENSVQFVLV
ncbi:MAG: hypothetical protein QNK23_00725 [Crocinitomicaceae bacterium]|nr:hypothetical protein [Crocinitomicaceae bacterium]